MIQFILINLISFTVLKKLFKKSEDVSLRKKFIKFGLLNLYELFSIKFFPHDCFKTNKII